MVDGREDIYLWVDSVSRLLLHQCLLVICFQSQDSLRFFMRNSSNDGEGSLPNLQSNLEIFKLKRLFIRIFLFIFLNNFSKRIQCGLILLSGHGPNHQIPDYFRPVRWLLTSGRGQLFEFRHHIILCRWSFHRHNCRFNFIHQIGHCRRCCLLLHPWQFLLLLVRCGLLNYHWEI